MVHTHWQTCDWQLTPRKSSMMSTLLTKSTLLTSMPSAAQSRSSSSKMCLLKWYCSCSLAMLMHNYKQKKELSLDTYTYLYVPSQQCEVTRTSQWCHTNLMERSQCELTVTSNWNIALTSQWWPHPDLTQWHHNVLTLWHRNKLTQFSHRDITTSHNLDLRVFCSLLVLSLTHNTGFLCEIQWTMSQIQHAYIPWFIMFLLGYSVSVLKYERCIIPCNYCPSLLPYVLLMHQLLIWY